MSAIYTAWWTCCNNVGSYICVILNFLTNIMPSRHMVHYSVLYKYTHYWHSVPTMLSDTNSNWNYTCQWSAWPMASMPNYNNQLFFLFRILHGPVPVTSCNILSDISSVSIDDRCQFENLFPVNVFFSDSITALVCL